MSLYHLWKEYRGGFHLSTFDFREPLLEGASLLVLLENDFLLVLCSSPFELLDARDTVAVISFTAQWGSYDQLCMLLDCILVQPPLWVIFSFFIFRTWGRGRSHVIQSILILWIQKWLKNEEIEFSHDKSRIREEFTLVHLQWKLRDLLWNLWYLNFLCSL